MGTLLFLSFFFFWTFLFFKVFIEFVIILLLFYVMVFFFFFKLRGMWDLSSPTRDQTCTPCTGKGSLDHWTARRAPPPGDSLDTDLKTRIPMSGFASSGPDQSPPNYMSPPLFCKFALYHLTFMKDSH